MRDDVIDILKNQHNEINSLLVSVSSLNSETHPEKIEFGLKEFRSILLGHVDLEDNVFYPELLSRMSQKGMDIGKTKEFIQEMKVIAKTVLGFLDANAIASNIQKNANFSKELNDIAEQVKMRVSTEEDSVYMYW